MKSQLIIWNPVFSLSITLAVVALLFFWAISSENKKQQRFKEIRLLATTLACLSILGLMLRPAFTIVSKKSEIVLLTKNYNKQIVDSLLENNKQLKVVRMVDADEYPSSESYESNEAFKNSNDHVRFIVGEGVPANLLYKLKRTSFQYFPAPVPEGIVGLRFLKKIIANRWNTLEGDYMNRNSTIWLKLKNPGGIEDSVSISGKGRNQFSLFFYPRQEGKFMYELIEKDSITGEEQVHSLPLEIVSAESLRILFLTGYPTFEQRFLKNYLIDHNHQLVLRNQISKDRYHIETANRSSLSFQSITNELLEDMDLVLVDPASYAALSGTELHILDKAIHNGLGVLILPETTKDRIEVKPLIQFREVKRKTDTAHIVFNKWMQFQLPALPLQTENSVVPVLSDNKKNVVSGYVYKGLGKVSFQLLQETYSLVLQNNKEVYAALWSDLLEQSAREKQKNNEIGVDTDFPNLVGDPVNVTVSSVSTPEFHMDSISYPLMEDVRLDDVWYGEIVPLTKGWHVFQLDNIELPFYIFERGEWQSMAIKNQMDAMKKNANIPLSDSLSSLYVHQIDVSIWLLIILLLSATILWLIPKL